MTRLVRDIFRDIRFAFRKYRVAPGPTLAIVLTLALGIGANSAIFSLVDGAWLRPLAIKDASHLVAISSVKNHAAADAERETGSSYGEFEDVRARVTAFADVIAVDHRGIPLVMPDGIKLLNAEVVSDNYFTFTGARAEVGHLPDEAEIHRAQTPLIVVSHKTWMSVFGGDKSVVGKTLTTKGGAAVLVAVLPAEFHGTERLTDPQTYVPRSTWTTWFPSEAKDRTYRNFDVFARPRLGATLDQARAQLNALSAELAASYPQANRERTFQAGWETDTGNPMVRLLGMILLGIGAAVLLLACTNIANLLLSLNDARGREIAMRAALGASRTILLRQLVTECALLAAIGVAGALILAERIIALVPRLIPDVLGFVGPDFRVDHRVFGFTVVVGALAVVLCGLLPAIAATRKPLLDAMRAHALPAGRMKMPARRIFVSGQVAASMVLLTITALLVRALVRVETMDLGFNSHENAVVAQFEVPHEGAARQMEAQAMAERVRAIPGVKDATVSRVVPFALMGTGATAAVLAPGETPGPTAGTLVWFNHVDSAYFRVMGVPILRGRVFGSQDTAQSERVVIVNETLARRMFGTADAVGRHLRMGRENPTDAEIVGVTRDGKYADVGESAQPYLYIPIMQEAWTDMALTATTAGDPRALVGAVRKAMHDVDPDALVITSETMTDHMKLAMISNRMAAGLTATMGGLALLLTVIGLYGVIAYSVSRRTHEIGIRMALGAQRGSVGGGVVRDGLKLVLAGMMVGVAGSAIAGRSMSSLLFGVKPLDPAALASVAAVMLVVSLAAMIAPARRALRVDPVVALRDE